MSGIVLSGAVRSNLITLQNTADLQAKVQERLSTGKKVNSALDNPTNFFTASGLSRRATNLSALLDGMSQGIKTLEAADNGMRSITKTVETMQANIRQARQDKSFKGVSYSIDAATIGTSTVKNLSFSGGAVGTTPVNVAVNSTDVGGTAVSQKLSGNYASPAAATAGVNTFAYAASATAFGAPDTVTFDINVDGAGAQTVTIDQAAVQAVGNNDSTIDSITEYQSVLQATIDTAVGAGQVTVSNNGTNITLTSASTGASSSVAITNATPDADAGAAANTLYGLANGAGTAGQAAVTLDFSVNGTNISIANGRTLTQAVSDVNTTLGASSAFEAFDDGSNHLGIRAKAVGVTTLTIAGTDAGKFAAVVAGTAPTTAGAVKTVDQLVTDINGNASLTGKIRASNDGGKLRIDNLSTEALTVVGATATGVNGGTGPSNTQTISGNDVRKGLITQFNDLRKQLDKLASDGSYNGINLIKADKLKITFNEFGTSSIEIQAKDTAGTVRGISTESNSLNIAEATAAEFSTDTDLDARLEKLNDSLTTLQTQSSSFGAALTTVQNRQEFTKAMINTLQQGSDSLTLADSNEEGANLLALNTRQQLSQTALSLASQASQAVLRLF